MTIFSKNFGVEGMALLAPLTTRMFETPGLHGCEIACALKQTFVLCKIFLQGTRAPTWGRTAPGRVEKCRPPVSGVTRGLSQGGKFSEGGPLAIVWACNN